MDTSGKIVIHWFRRDLRLEDNTALFHALSSGLPVQCLFIFDTNILDALEEKKDPRVLFIHRQLSGMNEILKQFGGCIHIFTGRPEDVWKNILAQYNVSAIYCNRDYEPYAKSRDEAIAVIAEKKQISFYTFKDHVILEPWEVLKDNGEPYTVYTPYKNKYLGRLHDSDYESFGSYDLLANIDKTGFKNIPPLESFGFKDFPFDFPGKSINPAVIISYEKIRDFPAKAGTSRLSLHLRFGTISIRHLMKISIKTGAVKFQNELIWREFYQMILWHFPHTINISFKKGYDRIPWRNDEMEFKKWCTGTTGYPIVDAGMRELNASGFMHNRVRMITASFLVKHLLIDWRWGAAYFEQKLLDFEAASNTGGWQWAAGSGCDAAPYFRIFNPSEQTKKFDPDHEYIRKWVPEWNTIDYPEPVVEHKFARERCLKVFKSALMPA